MLLCIKPAGLPGARGGTGHNPAFFGRYMDWLCDGDHLRYLADTLRVSKVNLTARRPQKNSGITAGLGSMWREEQVRRAGGPKGGKSSKEMCWGAQRAAGICQTLFV